MENLLARGLVREKTSWHAVFLLKAWRVFLRGKVTLDVFQASGIFFTVTVCPVS